MAVSSSTDFKSVGTELVAGALSRLGVLAEEEPLQANELERALRLMTQMFKTWEAKGLGGWLHTEDGFALVSADKDYVFGSGGTKTYVPFSISQVRVSYNSGNEIPMQRYEGRQAYYSIPNRTSSGYPTTFFYDRQRDSGTLYVWPVPNNNDYDITYTYRRRIMDMDLGAENTDLPPEWEEAIELGLAKRLIGPYAKAGQPIAAKIMQDADEAFNALLDFDTAEEEGSVFMVPDGYR
jgi:hypothetical protein